MSALSNYGEKLLLDWMMTGGAATRPTSWFLALFTTATDDAAGGTEVSGNGYARQPIVFGAASSPGGNTSTTAAVNFTAVGGNWGSVPYAAIYDAAVGGNRLWHGALDAPKTINDGDTFAFAVGAGNLTLA